MKQKPSILNTNLNSDSKLIEKPIKPKEIMTTTLLNDLSEESMMNIGILAPDGMKWDYYGNAEFIED